MQAKLSVPVGRVSAAHHAAHLPKLDRFQKPLCPITKLNFLLEMALEERISIKALSRNSKSPKGCESDFVYAHAF
jgi:hypothetical protein